MVNRQIVLDTIKKMSASGIEESVIQKTLQDIGLSREEIEAFLKEASSPKKPETKNLEELEPWKERHEEIAEKTAQKVKEHLQEQREEQELRETTIHSAIDEHSGKISEMQEGISVLHEKVDGISQKLTDPELLKSIAELNKRIADFEQQLSDLKALGNAQKTVLEKILETNRKILEKM